MVVKMKNTELGPRLDIRNYSQGGGVIDFGLNWYQRET